MWTYAVPNCHTQFCSCGTSRPVPAGLGSRLTRLGGCTLKAWTYTWSVIHEIYLDPNNTQCNHTSQLASNPGFPFRILSRSFGEKSDFSPKLRDKIGKHGFEATFQLPCSSNLTSCTTLYWFECWQVDQSNNAFKDLLGQFQSLIVVHSCTAQVQK